MDNNTKTVLKSGDVSKSQEHLKSMSTVSEVPSGSKSKSVPEECLQGDDEKIDLATKMVRDTIARSASTQERLGEHVEKMREQLGSYDSENLHLLNRSTTNIEDARTAVGNVATATEKAKDQLSKLLSRRKDGYFCPDGQESDYVEPKEESIVDLVTSDSDDTIIVPGRKKNEVKTRVSQRVRKQGGSFCCDGCMRTIWGETEAIQHQQDCKVKDAKVRSAVYPHQFVTELHRDSDVEDAKMDSE